MPKNYNSNSSMNPVISLYFSINSIIVAISFSVIIGILAGIVPAYQASKLKPVDALRYE